MIIETSDEIVLEMGRLAILASIPMGMGFLHANPMLQKHEIKIGIIDDRLSIDYYQGRMVKFYAQRILEGRWRFADEIHSDYQSWIRVYSSYQELFDVANK